MMKKMMTKKKMMKKTKKKSHEWRRCEQNQSGTGSSPCQKKTRRKDEDEELR